METTTKNENPVPLRAVALLTANAMNNLIYNRQGGIHYSRVMMYIEEWQRQLEAAALREPTEDVLFKALENLVDGMSVATGRLRRGYGELHPGIPAYCDSLGHLASEARAALAAITAAALPPPAEDPELQDTMLDYRRAKKRKE